MRGFKIRLGNKIVVSCWLLVVSFLTIFLIPNIALASPIIPEKIIELTNQKRIESGVEALSVSPQLTVSAQNKAFDMVQRNYWSHQTPDGSPFWIFINKENYNWDYLGENLASDFKDSENIIQAWYFSPSHQRNMLNENYQDIGVGVYKNIVVSLYGQEKQGFIHTLSNNLSTLVSKLLDVFSF